MYMKLNFKDVFSVQTDETKYKPTVLSYIIFVAFLVIVITISNFIPIVLLARFIMVFLTALVFYLTIAFFSKLIFISENIEKKRIKEKKYKFKYDSIFFLFYDLIKWLNAYSALEQILIKLRDEYHYIEISYDTKGRRGKYINRKTFIDDIETRVEDIKKMIESNCSDGKIEILETYDHQNPNLLIDEINELK